MLNEQAAQLMGDTINLLLAAREQEDAIAEAVYEDVLKQISHINHASFQKGT